MRKVAMALFAAALLPGVAHAYASAKVSGRSVTPIEDVKATGTAHAAFAAADQGGYASSDPAAGLMSVGAWSDAFGTSDNLALMDDVMNVSIAGADADTVTQVRFDIALGGALGGSNVGNYGMEARFMLTSKQLISHIWYDLSSDYLYVNAGTIDGDYLGTNCTTHGTSTDMRASCLLTLKGAVAQIALHDTLRAMAGGGVASDPDHADFTARIRFSGPANVTFTSASGDLLSGAVPEPTSWAMMLAGFGLVGGSLRSRRTLSKTLA